MSDLVPSPSSLPVVRSAAQQHAFAWPRSLADLREMARQPAVARALPMLGLMGVLLVTLLLWTAIVGPDMREIAPDAAR